VRRELGILCPFDPRTLNRLLGRGGRIADTPDPARYATVFRRLVHQFGNRFRYGFMLPVNLLLEGVIDHAIYHEPRVPQLTAMTVYGEENGQWRVRTVLGLKGGALDEPGMPEKLTSLYGDFGVGMLVLTPQMIDEGYLRTDEFAEQLNHALLSDNLIPSLLFHCWHSFPAIPSGNGPRNGRPPRRMA